MTGWMGRVLELDLATESSSVLELTAEILHRFVGGKGLAGYLFRPAATLDYDDPDMPLVIMTGPLVGTPSPTSGRSCILSRSPLTGTIGDTSVGGSLGVQVKRAGWDGVVIRGRADGLCGVMIDGEGCRFVDATAMRGQPAGELHRILESEGATVCTGPAADHGVAFSSLMVDHHYASGRSGLGLVLAAKNLKFLTVRGNGQIAVHDRGMLMSAREDIRRLIAASPILMGELGLTHFGTGALYDLMANRRMMPTRNFRETHFDDAQQLNANAYRQRYGTRKRGCRGCHIQCKKTAQDGRALPEFETMSHFSALVDNHDIETVVRANEICNDYGMDTISAAGALACFAETEGRSLNPSEILSLLDAIGRGEGIGRELGRGSAAFARSAGRPELSMSVKGMDLPAYDPRGAYGMALAYATSTRGACHLRAYPIGHEILRKPVATDRFSFDGKARIIKIAEDMNAVVDSLTACKFVFLSATLEEFARAYTAVTGIEATGHALLRTGERIYYQDRLVNAANGFTAEHDDLPSRFFEQAGSSGDGVEVPPLDRESFLAARARYYKVRGLTPDGLPSRARCEELELAWNP